MPVSAASRQPPTAVFITDFGTKDGAVAVVKGVMWAIAPELRIVDLTHEVEPYDIEGAGSVLEQAAPYYPAGTVFLSVVDPGVGSARRGMAARTKAGRLLVGPDNGTFTALLDREGLDAAVELKDARYHRVPDAAATFHGRDIFGPAAAHLAAGLPLEKLGPALVPTLLTRAPARVEGKTVVGRVAYLEDPYGNVITDIPPALLAEIGAAEGTPLSVRIGAKDFRLPFRRTFSDVPAGEPLALFHEREVLSFSINMGDFAAKHRIKRGDAVRVRR